MKHVSGRLPSSATVAVRVSCRISSVHSGGFDRRLGNMAESSKTTCKSGMASSIWYSKERCIPIVDFSKPLPLALKKKERQMFL